MNKKTFAFPLLLLTLGLFSCSGTSVSSSSSDLTPTYEVTFQNFNNVFLYKTKVKEGEPAVYQGKEPVRGEDVENTYTFSGWDKDISAVYSDLLVTAVFEPHSKVSWGSILA